MASESFHEKNDSVFFRLPTDQLVRLNLQQKTKKFFVQKAASILKLILRHFVVELLRRLATYIALHQ